MCWDGGAGSSSRWDGGCMGASDGACGQVPPGVKLQQGRSGAQPTTCGGTSGGSSNDSGSGSSSAAASPPAALSAVYLAACSAARSAEYSRPRAQYIPTRRAQRVAPGGMTVLHTAGLGLGLTSCHDMSASSPRFLLAAPLPCERGAPAAVLTPLALRLPGPQPQPPASLHLLSTSPCSMSHPMPNL